MKDKTSVKSQRVDEREGEKIDGISGWWCIGTGTLWEVATVWDSCPAEYLMDWWTNPSSPSVSLYEMFPAQHLIDWEDKT